MALEVSDLRKEFPALNQLVNHQPLIYFDSAATTLKPRAVIERISTFYSFEASNVHRGAHYLSDRATDHFEEARLKVAKFINAKSSNEIIFVRGTTEGLNLLAYSLGENLNEGDEIILTDIEHHANIVPWQILAQRKKLTIKVLKAQMDGTFKEEDLKELLSSNTKILSLTHASNHLGTIINLKPLIDLAHRKGLLVVVDGAQAIGKMTVDMQALDADFYTFSGHKMFAPFGIGIVYGKSEQLNLLPPYQGGGSMISSVSFSGTTYNSIPFKFEAGTPNVGGAIALATAIDFIQQIGLPEIENYEQKLNQWLCEELFLFDELTLYGPKSPALRIPVFAMNIKGLHGSDLGFILNQQGIAVRTGHHCTQPLVNKLGLNGSLRASLSIYNTESEIHQFISALKKTKELLK